jgi:TolB-like protein/Tfp pilus assembly protein PilF
MKSANFLAELKRRNVYKVAAAYLVVSWLLIQAASILFPTFDAPVSAMKILVVILAIGFPIALAFSWAFEITPEGLKLESEIDPNRSIAQHTGKKIVGLTVAIAVIAAGLFAYQLLRPHGAVGEAVSFPPKQDGKLTASPTNEGLAGARPSTAPAATNIPEKSIAVLPFDNLSHDPDNAYFSEGIQDEILTRLAKIAELKVISRTSTQRFKSSPNDLRQIAQQLGVANILEGSVQKVNDQVRVNVQLIKASTDAHLWAEVYDRKLTDIFGVESDIARTVAETLKAKLTGSAEHVLSSKPTADPEAYQLYLKGRYFWNRRTEENIKKSIDYFQQAVEKDPSYALAYAGLADGYALMPIYSPNPPKEDIQRAMAAARRAIELDDSLSEAHTALANTLVDDLQFAEAEKSFKRAIELNPNYATAHQWYGESLQGQGRFAEALVQLKKAHELDPLSLIINAVLGSTLGTNGDYDGAIQQFRRTLEMEPGFGPALFMLGETYEDKGQMKEAMKCYEDAVSSTPTVVRRAMVARIIALHGNQDEARKTLADLTELSHRQYVPSYPLALIHLALGDKEEAILLLEKAYDERGIQLGGNTGSLQIDKRLDPLRSDPRFKTLLAKYMGETK